MESTAIEGVEDRGAAVRNARIGALLRQYSAAKREAREVREEMMRVAVDELGLEQSSVRELNLETFFDGYLVGQGVVQGWRKG